MRLNRTLAQFRDRDRHLEGSSTRSNPEDEACRYFRNDLVGEHSYSYVWYTVVKANHQSLANWKRRTEIIHYCVDIVNESIVDKQQSIETEEMSAQARNKLRNAQYAEEVKVSSISSFML